MSKSLYDEAIEAAEELKNATEKKVTENLIATISPKIKKIIESKLLFEDKEHVENENFSEEEFVESSSLEEDPDECGTGTYEVSESAKQTLNALMTEDYKKQQTIAKLEEIKNSVSSLKKAVFMSKKFNKLNENKTRFGFLYKNLLKDLRIIESNYIFKKDEEIKQLFLEISKELINMSTRRSRRRYLNEDIENLLEMNLFEDEGDMSDPEGEMPEDPDMGDLPEDDDDDEMDVQSSDSGSLDLGSLSGETIDDVLAAAQQVLGEEDLEEDLEEGVFFEMDEVDEMAEIDEMGACEGEEGEGEPQSEVDEALSELDELYGESSRRNGDVFLEIDESMLKREIGKMKRLREGEAKDMASHFGGGSLEGEAFVDGVELNKLHEMKIKAAKVIRKNRMLESKLSQYKKALRGMKGQLVEMNLFNAKLLYANKLMQNRDLTMSQQRNIVESLDEAKTLGEAKILFESLSKSLVTGKRNSRKSKMTESVNRRRSSASSAVRSGQTINENVALDRWATLAGIRKN